MPNTSTPFTVTKEVQFDAAHRVPNHASQCFNLHGHRYRVAATIIGRLVLDAAAADEGMVLDFSTIKQALVARVHEPLDHGTIAAVTDTDLIAFVRGQGWKLRVLALPPTAEVLAAWCYGELNDELGDHLAACGAHIDSVAVWETPASCATYSGVR